MRDVVIIGGGLSGLAAAYELEQQHIPYTLIEVKPRLGGSIQSVRQNGFILDSGPMVHETDAFLLNYAERLGVSLQDGVFTFGTGALIDALASHITAPIMYRMAVSTLGRMDDRRFSICMENGMLLDARALIVAAPARHTERMFYTLTPEISYRLLDYRYDTISRLSFAYHDQPLATTIPDDYPITAIQHTTQAGRVPPGGGMLLQAALRIAEHDLPNDPIGQIAALMDWPLNPLTDHIATWSESDPIMWRDPVHRPNMEAIEHLLPPGVGLAGSDYLPTDHAPRLSERIRQGMNAAARVISWLRSSL